MIKLYRIEDKNHVGMYCSNKSDSYLRFILDTSGRHPMPSSDDQLMKSLLEWRGDDNYYGLHFAFSSIDQLKLWVFHYRCKQILKDEGFTVAVLETENAAIGDTQAIFDYDEATQVDTLDITEI